MTKIKELALKVWTAIKNFFIKIAKKIASVFKSKPVVEVFQAAEPATEPVVQQVEEIKQQAKEVEKEIETEKTDDTQQ